MSEDQCTLLIISCSILSRMRTDSDKLGVISQAKESVESQAAKRVNCVQKTLLDYWKKIKKVSIFSSVQFNPLNPELNPICYLLALLGAHHFLHVSRIRVKLLTFRLLISYIYMEHPFLMFLDHTQRRRTVGRTPLDK